MAKAILSETLTRAPDLPAVGRGSYAVVFSGGGLLAAWEVGCLEAIIEHEGGWPSTVTGASAGAINAAAVCAGYNIAGLNAIWNNLTPRDVYRRSNARLLGFGARVLYHAITSGSLQRGFRRAGRRFHSVLDAQPLQQTLSGMFHGRELAFRRGDINLAISITDLGLGRRLTLYKRARTHRGPVPFSGATTDAEELGADAEDLVDALMATTALPLIFRPHELDFKSGPRFASFDGGVLGNHPIAPAIEFGEENIYVLVPTPKVPRLPLGFMDILNSLLETWTAASLDAQLELVEHINKARNARGDKPVRIQVIRPHFPFETYGIGPLSFGSKHTATIIASGRADAELALRKSRLASR